MFLLRSGRSAHISRKIRQVSQNLEDEKNGYTILRIKDGGDPEDLPGAENKSQELTHNMADFNQRSVVKTAVRELATPIADVSAFNTIVQAVITDNPLGCVAYTEAGVTHQPVEKSKENYVAKIVYQDGDGKAVGTDSCKFGSVAGFNAGATALLADTALATAHNGTAVRDSDNETYSATLKCRDPNGEIYMITFTRERVSLTSYSDDAIRTKVETWADSVAALA